MSIAILVIIVLLALAGGYATVLVMTETSDHFQGIVTAVLTLGVIGLLVLFSVFQNGT